MTRSHRPPLRRELVTARWHAKRPGRIRFRGRKRVRSGDERLVPVQIDVRTGERERGAPLLGVADYVDDVGERRIGPDAVDRHVEIPSAKLLRTATHRV